MDAQTKTAPGSSRRGSSNNAMGIAGGYYHGTIPPNPAPSPRDPLTISRDLYAAAEVLADMAEDFTAGVYDARALSAADALLIGCCRLVCELRVRRAREAA